MADENGEKALLRRDIEELENKVDCLSRKIDRFFSAEGICERERMRVAKIAAQTAWQWVAVTVLAGCVGYLFRAFIEHVQRTGG